jgi:hypothetical protein
MRVSIFWRIFFSARDYKQALDAVADARLRKAYAQNVVDVCRAARYAWPATEEWTDWMRKVSAALNEHDRAVSALNAEYRRKEEGAQ